MKAPTFEFGLRALGVAMLGSLEGGRMIVLVCDSGKPTRNAQFHAGELSIA